MNKVYFLCVVALGFLTACSESEKVTGTAVEPNEIAQQESSSSLSEVLSSDNAAPTEPAGNNDPVPSGTSQTVYELSSSSNASSKDVSADPEPTDTPNNGNESATNSKTLDFRLTQYGLTGDYSFDSGVYGAVVGEDRNTLVPSENPADSTLEETSATPFDGPGVKRFDENTMPALYTYFPETADNLMAAVAAAQSTDSTCNLYMVNVRGETRWLGYVLAGVTADTLTFLDVTVGACTQSSVGTTTRFAFIYCGKMQDYPEEDHVPVANDLTAEECSTVNLNGEWVKLE